MLLLDLEPGPATGGSPLDLEIAADERLLGRLQIDHRCEVCVPLSMPLPARLVLRHVGPIVAVPQDLRTLCQRLFRVRYEKPGKGEHAEIRTTGPSLRSIRRFTWIRSGWAALQHVIARLAKMLH